MAFGVGLRAWRRRCAPGGAANIALVPLARLALPVVFSARALNRSPSCPTRWCCRLDRWRRCCCQSCSPASFQRRIVGRSCLKQRASRSCCRCRSCWQSAPGVLWRCCCGRWCSQPMPGSRSRRWRCRLCSPSARACGGVVVAGHVRLERTVPVAMFTVAGRVGPERLVAGGDVNGSVAGRAPRHRWPRRYRRSCSAGDRSIATSPVVLENSAKPPVAMLSAPVVLAASASRRWRQLSLPGVVASQAADRVSERGRTMAALSGRVRSVRTPVATLLPLVS